MISGRMYRWGVQQNLVTIVLHRQPSSIPLNAPACGLWIIPEKLSPIVHPAALCTGWGKQVIRYETPSP